jgi:zinc transport system permease protein
MTVLSFAFMQKALVACTVVCGVAPLVGAFIVQRRQSLIGDGMGHVAFAGVGLAFLWGMSPFAGALTFVALATLVLFALQRGGLGGDLSLALIFYGGIAFGFLFLMRSGIGVNRVLGLLFGSPLNLSWGEVAAIVVMSFLVLATVLALYGPLLAIAFDESAARVSGVRTDTLVLALTFVVGVVIVGGMYALGLLLIAAMMVVPVAAASKVASSYRGTLVLAALIGAGSAVAGLLVAFYADFTPGASIVITALACYVASASIGAARHRVGERRARVPASRAAA